MQTFHEIIGFHKPNICGWPFRDKIAEGIVERREGQFPIEVVGSVAVHVEVLYYLNIVSMNNWDTIYEYANSEF